MQCTFLVSWRKATSYALEVSLPILPGIYNIFLHSSSSSLKRWKWRNFWWKRNTWALLACKASLASLCKPVCKALYFCDEARCNKRHSSAAWSHQRHPGWPAWVDIQYINFASLDQKFLYFSISPLSPLSPLFWPLIDYKFLHFYSGVFSVPKSYFGTEQATFRTFLVFPNERPRGSSSMTPAHDMQ